MSELLQHWNLALRPFEAPWDSRFFYESRQHNEALERLLYLVDERSMNIGVLTGDIGCGKTLTRAVMQECIADQNLTVVAIENSGFTMEELLGFVLSKLDPTASPPSTKMACLARIEQIIGAEAVAGRHVVILLDEAQDLLPDTLRELRLLTNFNGNGRSVLTLVLIGQPCLGPLIEAAPAIDQRVSLRFHLLPLGADEMPSYLAHRLHVAGHPNGLLFDEASAALIHRFTRGVPREINRLAKLLLEQGWMREAKGITSDHVSAVARDLKRYQSLSLTAAHS